MKTVKRTTANIQTDDITNTNKYFNQMEFKGIQEDENIYTTDQEALRDALNVYVDDDKRLVSRPTLQEDQNTPEGVVPEGYNLVESYNINNGTLYVSQKFIANTKYRVVNLCYSKDGKLYNTILSSKFSHRFSTSNTTFNGVPTAYVDIEVNLLGDRTEFDPPGGGGLGPDPTTGAERYTTGFCHDINATTAGWSSNYWHNGWPGFYIQEYSNYLNGVYFYFKVEDTVLETPESSFTLDVLLYDNYVGKAGIYASYTKNGNVQYFHDYYEFPPVEYKIAVYDKYIIAFCNHGAQVFDLSTLSGWKDFNSVVDIPITKRVVGSTETTYPGNNFTEAYKEQYIWSNQSHPAVPSDPVNVDILASSGNWTYDYDATVYPLSNNQRYSSGLVDPANQVLKYIPNIDNVNHLGNSYCYYVKHDVISRVSTSEYFEISFDSGKSYIRVYLPFGPEETLLLNGALSDDGNYAFCVTNSGVYICNLGDFTWSEKESFTLLSNSPSLREFTAITNDKYAFLVSYYETSSSSSTLKLRLYFKGPGLYGDGTTFTTGNGKLCYIDNFYYRMDDTSPDTHTLEWAMVANVGTVIGASRLKMCTCKGFGSVDTCAIVLLRDRQAAPVTTTSVLFVVGGNNPLGSNVYASWGIVNDFAGILDMKAVNELNPATQANLENFKSAMIVINVSLITGSRQSSKYGSSSSKRWSWCPWDYQVGIYTTSLNNGIRSIPLSSAVSDITRRLLPEAMGDYATENLADICLSCIPIRTQTAYIHIRNLLNNYKMKGTEVSDLAIMPMSRWPNGQPDDWFYCAEPDSFQRGQISRGFYSTSDGVWFAPAQLIADGAYFYYVDAYGNILTNRFSDDDSVALTYTISATESFKEIPDITYDAGDLYLGFGNTLQITQNTQTDGKTLLNLPDITTQTFTDDITGMINISTTEIAIFFKDRIVICQKVADSNLASGYRYEYYNTKLTTGVRNGDSIINTLEGTNTIFPTRRGLALMNYQAFMATTDQVLTYITDPIKNLWTTFYDNSEMIKIIQFRTKLLLTNGTTQMLIYDMSANTWWRWELPVKATFLLTDQVQVQVSSDKILVFKDTNARYMDFSETGKNVPISWFVMSQPLHMKASNYYKNLKQLVFQFYDADETNKEKTIQAQIKLYRKKITLRDPETIAFTIDNLRTFVKRFNYWKINEVQWALANDTETAIPTKLELNGISVKYELGEEVR